MKMLVALLFWSVTFIAHADEAALNQTLVRIIQQINALMPLLDEAQTEIPPNTRITLHIDSFEGEDGNMHLGLRDDLLSIRTALIEYINQPALEPKTIEPLEHDFIGK